MVVVADVIVVVLIAVIADLLLEILCGMKPISEDKIDTDLPGRSFKPMGGST